jgi:hypothetical protein
MSRVVPDGCRRTLGGRWRWAPRLGLVALLLATGRVQAADFTVDANGDGVDAQPGDGMCATAAGACTLRAAVQEANALPGADTITLPAATYTLSIPGANEDGAATGDLDVSDTLSIIGPSTGRATIAANRMDRVFDVLPGVSLLLTRVTLADGNLLSDNGAGVRNQGTLQLDTVSITRCVAADGDGAGIANLPGAVLHAASVTLSLNVAAGFGGGLANFSGATAQLTNVTISDNAALSGGGVFNDAEPAQTTTLVELANVTLSDNSAAEGASLRNLGTARIHNSIFVDSPAVSNCSGKAVESLGYNILSDSLSPCAFDQSTDRGNTDPLLEMLRDNGGGTATQALLPGSPAIDSGDDANCPPTDQRGVARPQDGDGDGRAGCDVGAFEVAGPATPSPTPTGSETATPQPTATPTAVTPTPTFPSIEVATVTGYPGQQVSFAVTLHTQGALVISAGLDIAFDALNTPILANQDVQPDCTVNPDIRKQSVFDFLPPGCSGSACTAISTSVFPIQIFEAIPDGATLYTCRVGIAATAPLGEYALTVSSVELVDPLSNDIPGVRADNGKILVVPEPTSTPTPTDTATPTDTPTLTPTPRPCTGDCNDQRVVVIENLVRMVNIAAGRSLLSSCPNADPNGDHTVSVDEILSAVHNATDGCPN